jgi:hypothetical protein
MGSEAIEFEIKVKQNDLKKALEGASSQAKGISDSLSTGLKPALEESQRATELLGGSMSNFTSNTLSIAAGTLAFNLFSSAIGFVRNSITGSISAYSESEDAVNRLGQALRSTGSFSQLASLDIQNFASRLQASSKFNDEAILEQFSFAKSLGTTNEQAKNLVTAAANLSATLGGSLEENTQKLGKTLAGTSGRLGQLIPDLRSLTVEQLKNGEAANLINQKYGGAAANELNTYSGSVAALKNSFNDLQERIGASIVQSTTFQSVMRALKASVDGSNESAKVQETLQRFTAEGFSKAATNSTQLANDFQTLTERSNKLDAEIIRLTDTGTKLGNKDLYFAQIASLKNDLLEIEKVKAGIEERLNQRGGSIQDKPEGAITKQRSDSELQDERKKQAEILAIQKTFALEKDNFEQAQEDLKIKNESIRNQAEIERLAVFNKTKAEIEAQKKLKEAEEITDIQNKALEKKKINLEKELALEKINADKTIALTKNTVKVREEAEAARDEYEKKLAKDRVQNQADTFSKIATLSDSNNKTLAGIGKAAAITQIAIDGPQAVTKALAAFPPPFNFVAAALVGTAVAEQAAKVAGVQFENGGFVGGMAGATIGPDNRVAQIRDGELVLNANQQKNLLELINGGASGGDIVVQIDGKEIARAVRNQKQAGFKL